MTDAAPKIRSPMGWRDRVAGLGRRTIASRDPAVFVRIAALVALAAIGIANVVAFPKMQKRIGYWPIEVHKGETLADRAFKDPDARRTLYPFFRMRDLLQGARLVVSPDSPISRVNFTNLVQVTLLDREFEAEIGPEQRAWLMRLQPETLEWYGEPVFHVIVKDGASKKVEQYRVLVQGRELFIIPESVYQRLADRL